MFVTRRFSFAVFLALGTIPVLLGGAWALAVYTLHALVGWQLLRIPFLPVATIGTAVAFYVGFKNNAAYDRFWEGRKIWGGIVNVSRTFAANVLAYVELGSTTPEARAVRQQLIYRILAWVNALRLQLRKNSRFFDKPARSTRLRLEKHAEHMRNDWNKELLPFLSADELAQVSAQRNPATHLLNRQGLVMSELQRDKRLDLFHQIALMEHIRDLYDLQGRCERIKNTPFPRQYAESGRFFVRVFILMVPFGLLDVFGARVSGADSTLGTALQNGLPMVVSAALITWVFMVMEGIGDASEDPFERSMNDVPMNALCRTIEADLRQMLGETEIPDPEKPVDHLLY